MDNGEADAKSRNDIAVWEDGFQPGLHGPLERPDGQKGYLYISASESARSKTWMPLGLGQDLAELRDAAYLYGLEMEKEQPDQETLAFLGDQLARLARPANNIDS